MPIFNSLGSNYDLKYILKSLFSNGSFKDLEKLKHLLEKRYGGEAILFYKGREAMSAALEILKLPKGSEVAINGFTCVAVCNAIRTAGYEPKCIDIEKDNDLNFSSSTLEKTVRSNENIKTIVVQNTFGYPCDIEGIERVCKKYKLILIEDLAHCVGTHYANGKEAGTVGDFTILSFSQDKIIDAVSGGGLVIRNKKYSNQNIRSKAQNPKNSIRDRLYPHLTYKIRVLYSFGLGKPYHFLLKKLNLLSNIMNKSLYSFFSLPNWNAAMALYMFENLEKQLTHRRKIAGIYVSQLPENIFMLGKKKTQEVVSLSSNLRFPVFIDTNRDGLVNKLKKHSIFLSDIWYTDVAPECPNAVADSKIIINLPTHINISKSKAKEIVKLINLWTQKQ